MYAQALFRGLLLHTGLLLVQYGYASWASNACTFLSQVIGQRLRCPNGSSLQLLNLSRGKALEVGAAPGIGALKLPGPNTLPPPRLVQPVGDKAAEQRGAARGLIARLLPHHVDAFLLRLGLPCHGSHAACFEVTVDGGKVVISGTTGTGLLARDMLSMIGSNLRSVVDAPDSLCAINSHAAIVKLTAGAHAPLTLCGCAGRRGACVRPACVPAGALQLIRGLGGHWWHPAGHELPAAKGAGGCGGCAPSVPRAQRAVPLLPERRHAQAWLLVCEVVLMRADVSATPLPACMSLTAWNGMSSFACASGRSGMQPVQARLSQQRAHAKSTRESSPRVPRKVGSVSKPGRDIGAAAQLLHDVVELGALGGRD